MYLKMPGKINSMGKKSKKQITRTKTVMILKSMKNMIIKDSVHSVLSANN